MVARTGRWAMTIRQFLVDIVMQLRIGKEDVTGQSQWGLDIRQDDLSPDDEVLIIALSEILHTLSRRYSRNFLKRSVTPKMVAMLRQRMLEIIFERESACPDWTM